MSWMWVQPPPSAPKYADMVQWLASESSKLMIRVRVPLSALIQAFDALEFRWQTLLLALMRNNTLVFLYVFALQSDS